MLARDVNDFMPKHMVNLTQNALKRTGTDLGDAKIALLGWAFTKNSGDVRDSPSEVCWAILVQGGARVKIHDPYVSIYNNIPISNNLRDVVRDTDAIVIMTGHDEYAKLDPIELKALSGQDHPVIVDGRNVVSADEFIAHGFVYKGIGRGDKNEHALR